MSAEAETLTLENKKRPGFLIPAPLQVGSPHLNLGELRF
jgi:hypothetical protein